MKNLIEITDVQVMCIAKTIGELPYYFENGKPDITFTVEKSPHIRIRLHYPFLNSTKYLEVHTNGMVEMYTYNPSLIFQIKHLPVNGLPVTDYLRSAGYKFHYEINGIEINVPPTIACDHQWVSSVAYKGAKNCSKCGAYMIIFR